MLDFLQNKLDSALKLIRGKAKITDADIDATMKSVRMALLEADVNFKVAKDLCDRAAVRAKGSEILQSLTPDQQIIKIVYEELVAAMGEDAPLNINVAPPAIILLVGLQGAGKTTTAGKLALFLKKQKRRPFLVPADVYRPAAIEQLQTIARKVEVSFFESNTAMNPVDIAINAVAEAKNRTLDTVIIDTAGRLQIDANLMSELQQIVSAVTPHEILLVADAMTGQQAVNVAKTFHETVNLNGLILTKFDGDARGGAALSMRAVTSCPIKFIGVSEKIDGLELFHPRRMASRILGMGDVLTLIEKATKEVSIDDALKMQKKMKRNEFSLQDFLEQMRMIKRMGNLTSLASMIPGMGKLVKDVNPDDVDKELKRVEAIILSMTAKERFNHQILDGSRRKRIAKGSGTSVEEVNHFVKQFMEMKKMMQMVSKGGISNLMGAFKGLPFGR